MKGQNLVNQGASSLKEYQWLLFFFICYFLVWIGFPQMLIFSDPWGYSEIAYRMSIGIFDSDPGSTFTYRFGVTVPLSIIYKLFGVNIYTTNIWPMFCGFMCIAGIWFLVPTLGSKVFAIVLCVTNITFFANIVNLYPDITTAAFSLWAVLILSKRNDLNSILSKVILGGVVALFLYISFSAKLTAYWSLLCLPYVLYRDIVDKCLKKNFAFYCSFIMTGIVLGVFHLILSQILWGSPIARFVTVQEYDHLWSIVSNAKLIDRLTVDIVEFVFKNYWAPLLLLLAGTLSFPQKHRIWLVYTYGGFFLFWFGTTRINAYEPLTLVDRNMIPVFVGMCIVSGHYIANITKKMSVERARVLVLVLCLIVSAPFIKYASQWKYKSWHVRDTIHILKEIIANKPVDTNTLVVSLDSRSPQAVKYFFEYEYPENLTVISIGELESYKDSIKGELYDDVYLYSDIGMSRFLSANYDQPLYDTSKIRVGAKFIYRSGGIMFEQIDKKLIR